MTTFGVTPTGFVRKTLADILADIKTRQAAAPALGPAFDNDDDSGFGQINGTIASSIAECWELLEAAFHGADPDEAEDYLLVLLAALTGTLKRGATFGTVALTVSLNAGTTLPAGQLVAVNGRADIVVVTDTTVDGTAGGTFPVNATFQERGAIPAFAGTLTQIVTPVTGWTAVTNAADAVKGREADTNVTLRQRREDELALRGGSTVRAIKADVTTVPFVNSASVLENTSDAYDINGLPPHSFETLIDDGDTPTASNTAIAQAIWDSKPAGIATFGGTVGTATDENGDDQVMHFSRVTLVPIFQSLTVTHTVDYPLDGDAQVKQALIDAGAHYGIGDDVIALAQRAAALKVRGVIDVPIFTLGFSASPVGTSNLSITVRQRATFDTANVVVTS